MKNSKSKKDAAMQIKGRLKPKKMAVYCRFSLVAQTICAIKKK
ncbi:hypothetical protein AGA_1P13 (plasmid) [Acetobacter orientalis]|uniref:Uncharacterized protein n=1 Tax=Acetobacter orientalis TaxID=146474 RepID=A0A2Z5ZLS2_9PROT|nr:hypothetical protein AGA_1P13 [Acetobacter orientalis]